MESLGVRVPLLSVHDLQTYFLVNESGLPVRWHCIHVWSSLTSPFPRSTFQSRPRS